MPELYDISGWNQQSWYSTGGTRDKKYVQSPDGKYYYFKKSFKKEDRGYFYEFWSEIVASEVGSALGFNILKYNLAIDKGEMGCISESMLNSDTEELIEGLKYLQAKDNKFKPEIRDTHKLYSFQLIVEALEEFGLGEYINHVIEIIIFDSIIGNGDRHQENWAFISQTQISNIRDRIPDQETDEESRSQIEESKSSALLAVVVAFLVLVVVYLWYSFHKKNKESSEKLADAENEVKEKRSHLRELSRQSISENSFDFEKALPLFFKRIREFTPIYDSGSSLGREKSNAEIEKMLANEMEIQNYIRKGKSEIHWDQKKVSHFELIAELLKTNHGEVAENVIRRLLAKYDLNKIQEVILHVDDLVPETMLIYRLPESRKRLMYKLIDLRVENLKRLIDK